MNVVNKLKPSHIKAFIKNKQYKYSLDKQYKIYKNKKKFVLIGTPEHGNLGDHAITIAQYSILKDNFNDYDFVELTLNEYFEKIEFIKKYIDKEDVIIINGGGNFGNQYLFNENIRRDVIERFPNNKIILFPQTIYFTKDDKGNKELEKSKEIYNKHKKLILVAREKKSYELMKKDFNKCKIMITPDIVLYLNECVNDINRSGALFCLRNDLEGKISLKEKEFILKQLKKNFHKVNVTDTIIDNHINKKERKEILKEKLNEFSKSELVITDRIHGMVFAAITATPCIALSNYNYKVKGTYEWIKKLNYIKFTDDIERISELIDELKHLNNNIYDNSELMKYYNEIIKCIVE